MSQLFCTGSTAALKRATAYPKMPMPTRVAMLEPSHFTVGHAINPHMQGLDGQLNSVDFSLAQQQWQNLRALYTEIGFEPKIFTALESCPDMVFCANQSLPYLDKNSQRKAILSRMASPIRRPEVEQIAVDLAAAGYEPVSLPASNQEQWFEGTGDALWVPGRRLLSRRFWLPDS